GGAGDDGGGSVEETRLWHPDRGQTLSMRSKEFAHDYRYFPEPDLVPLRPDPTWVAGIEAALPELPRARRARFAEQYGLPPQDAELLTGDPAPAASYEGAGRPPPNPQAPATRMARRLP